jgi:hypothetical protein
MGREPDQTDLRLQARRHVERVRNLKRHAAAYVAGAVLLATVWVVTQYQSAGGWPDRFAAGNDRPGTWSVWIVWPVLVWTQILAVHALVTYLRRPVPEAEVRRELERLEREC